MVWQAALLVGTSAVSLPLWCQWGARDIARWIGQEAAHTLRRVPSNAWWVTIVASILIAGLTPDRVHDAPWAIMTAMLLSLVVALARLDLACRLLPDALTMMLMTLGLLSTVILDHIDVMDSLIGGLTGYAGLWCLRWAAQRWRAHEGLGRGDLFMTAGMGTWLGWQMLPVALLIASATALIGTMLLRAITRPPPTAEHSDAIGARWWHQEIPFGPALGVGLCLALWHLG